MIKYILWDNDGVLVDTEKYYYRAIREVMRDCGVTITEEQYRQNLLVHSRGLWHLLEDRGYSGEEISGFRKRRDFLYLKYIETEDIAVPGAAEALEVLQGRYKMSIVTSSQRGHFEAIHRRTGFLRYMEFALTKGDYAKSKPDPAPYLTALRKMNAPANETVVIEDSLRGLESAVGAGLRCIVIPTALTATQDFSRATMVLDSVNKVGEAIKEIQAVLESGGSV
ncbi:MAG: HAD family phosphatase [Spirochaetae bacterium HGW-Spirochaetae-1]|jgi:HAD superfamily hydrolase (TIGR01509 family)|nr:MAG: HAD family phosphatase [Spirochaetae bacterium HGW-Spirochaetae-1]